MRATAVLAACCALLLPGVAHAFDAHKFKKCNDNAFCRRHRARVDEPPEAKGVVYSASPSTLLVSAEGARITVESSEHKVPLELRVLGLADGSSVRLRLREVSPMHPRFEPPHVLLNSGLSPAPMHLASKDEHKAKITLGVEGEQGVGEVVIEFSPLRVRFYAPGSGRRPVAQEVAVLNARGLLEYEHYRAKPEVAEGEDTPAEVEAGMWEESWQSHKDTKPRGPASVGFDLSFPDFSHVYGLPEHAASLDLKSTRGGDGAYGEPYRLFNLDVFEYALDTPFGLYGAVPFMLAHSTKRSVGAFWPNAAEMYVDVSREGAGTPGDATGNSVTHTHWIAESGMLDLFILLGPRPAEVMGQYTALTGTPFMPPLFATAYHQCRWNYNDDADVRHVDGEFEKNDIPYDVLWLDIEHTEGKRYFTWDTKKFPDPKGLQNMLAERGHRTVVIIDPHIKHDDHYTVFANAKSANLFVRTHDNSTFDGWCWPGSSSYIDFLDPAARSYWADQLQLDAYTGSTKHLHVWNDMNEPSVFNGPEVTMQKDCLHARGTVEHRDVHNMYGHLQAMSTREGLLRRGSTGAAGAQRERAFVLTRAFFAGTQRSAAVWTGDNMAKWEHLAATTPMLLSLGIGGISFAGADVGGFFYNPEPELLVRWYQVGAYHPFFRAHAHIETKRREPWILGEPYTERIREAVRQRYRLLPYIYTLFAAANLDGVPVVRPFFFQFPEDETCFAEEAAFFLGDALVVKPVAEAGMTETLLRLPGDPMSLYYDTHTGLAAGAGGTRVELVTPPDHIPVLQLGGTVLFKKERARRSSTQMVHDPYTIVIAPSSKGLAEGEIYVDDGSTFAYEDGDFAWRQVSLETGGIIRCGAHPTRPVGSADAAERVAELKARVERIVLYGVTKAPQKVAIRLGAAAAEQELSFTHDAGKRVLTIRKPDAPICEDWSVHITGLA